MSGGSSSAVAWFSRLEPAATADYPKRPDDPRLGEFIEWWQGDPARLQPGRAVLVGFPQDEGIRRNHGRAGAAHAPNAIRSHLVRLTPWDAASDTDLAQTPPLDAGNVRINGTLEETQLALAEVIGGILAAGAIPVVLGGGHETAFGHFLGYVRAGLKVGVINFDAHLDVRPCLGGLGHSGSPFRQALDRPTHHLAGYVCLGAQPHSVSREHLAYVREHGGRVEWADGVRASLPHAFERELQRLAQAGCRTYVTLDADVMRQSEMPAVSAPNAAGLPAAALLRCAELAGRCPHVASFDLVEINPLLDRDDQCVRWGALAVWKFLVGLGMRARRGK